MFARWWLTQAEKTVQKAATAQPLIFSKLGNGRLFFVRMWPRPHVAHKRKKITSMASLYKPMGNIQGAINDLNL